MLEGFIGTRLETGGKVRRRRGGEEAKKYGGR